MFRSLAFLLSFLFILLPLSFAFVVDHESAASFDDIPVSAIEQAKTNLHIVYQHTSHGSQLITGMNSLRSFPAYGDTYFWSDSGSSGLDLDDYGISGCADLSQGDSIDEFGVTPWVTATRNLLNNPANDHVNVVMWSWCSIDTHDIDRYLENMELLISEYGVGGSNPRAATNPVQFVFMTGHAEGQGEDGFIFAANQQIRAHVRDNDRILFDFADIESYDPDGVYYYDRPMLDNLDYTDVSYMDSNWAENWITNNPSSTLSLLTTGNGVDGFDGTNGCAHSSSPQEANLNCVLKGRASWYLFARLAGWNPDGGPQQTICGDGLIDPGEACDNSVGNGNVCFPPYDGSCSYCSTNCQIVTLQGGFCGDDICDMEEDASCGDCCVPSTEICGDGIDQDCDGEDLACATSGGCPQTLPEGMVFCYDFEDWTGDADTTPNYFSSTTYSTYWESHKLATEVVASGDANCNGRNAHSGNYYFHQGFYTGAIDPCLGTQPDSINPHTNIGFNGIYPANPKNNLELRNSALSDTLTVRTYFRVTGGWPSDVMNTGNKFMRIYNSGSSHGQVISLSDDGVTLDILEKPTPNNSDPSWSDYHNMFISPVNWDDGQWHSMTAVFHRYDEPTPNGDILNVSVWIDDWNMTGNPTGSAETYIFNWTPDWYDVEWMTNWDAENPDQLMGIDFDDIEIWDGVPVTSSSNFAVLNDGYGSLYDLFDLVLFGKYFTVDDGALPIIINDPGPSTE